MPRKAVYPDWVMKHLDKGIYVNHVGDKYYLYKAHSERKERNKNPVRVFDGYIGTVTEKDGLIPAKKTPGLFQEKVSALDYAVPFAVYSCTGKVLSGLRRTYRRTGTLIYVCSILQFLYSTFSHSLYEASWLSIEFPGVSFPEEISQETRIGIDRGTRMIADKVLSFYGEDWNYVRALLSPVVLIRMGGEAHYPSLSTGAEEIIQKYSLSICREEEA